MSLLNIDDIHNHLATIGESGHDIWMSSPASQPSIAQLETTLGFALPQSVRAYLAEFGALGINDTLLSGILNNQALSQQAGTLLGDTKTLRYELPNLANNLVVIQKHEVGAFCLELSNNSSSEAAVLNIQRSGQVKVARNFSEFLSEYLIQPWLPA